MNKHLFILPLTLFFVFYGCATVKVFHANPTVATVSNQYFDLQLEPQPAAGHTYFNAFRFVLTNKTNGPLSIVWEESFYLLNGRKNGQFGWEGMTFDELKEIRNNPYIKVGAGNSLTAVVFPMKLLARLDPKKRARLGESRSEDQFVRGPLPQGKNGMLLTVRMDGKVIQETVFFEISMT